METEEEYERLKSITIKAFDAYKIAIQQANFLNLQEIETKLNLLEAYVAVVKANADFTMFVNKVRKQKLGWS